MSAKWELESSDVDRLLDVMAKLPNRSEEVINRSLKEKGAPLAIQNIEKKINISKDWRGRVLNKKHAQSASPFKVTPSNLGFEITSKKPFNYLVFPDEGIGAHNKNAQGFMQKGLDESVPEIVEQLEKDVLEEINRTLGGN
ncbi:hypothetical protein [Paenilisteria rocourtiae]|uniref:HK97 gp10 family phage protein n=1 Tax=Listeria rocourtiae TaxID=647910 RepID=A0A4R6ZHG3_9LIST|nr:hypothetical protein [Listeria rocourtiae]EUJ46669.1 Gp9 protein [Listeria rocourtiae FSL F6-920]TDR51731.1 hypothetical protein DFP96_11137 [Listeria rocourtiae]